MRRRASLRRLIAALLLVTLTACGTQQTDRPDTRGGLTVGATADPPSIVLANLYAAALRYFGSPAQVEVVADPLAALDSGQLDVAPGFTGQLLQTFAPGTATGYGDEQVYKTLLGTLPEGITAGDYTTAAEDKPVAAVTAATASAWGGRELTRLVGQCHRVRPGAVRDVAIPARVGACKLPEPVEFDDSAALFAALKDDRINVAWASTADPAIPGDAGGGSGIVLLADRKPMLIPAENAVPLYRRNELDPQQVLALNQVAGALDTAALERMRAQVAGGADPRALADQWLVDNPLGR